jgi:hypothetical protein
MSGNSTNPVDRPKLHQELISDLAQFTSLHRAYAQLNEACAIDSQVDKYQMTFTGEEVNGILRQLGKDLLAGTFRVTKICPRPETKIISDDETNFRIRIVEIALTQALGRIFHTDPPINAISWTVAVLGQGLSRVYAVSFEEGGEAFRNQVLAAVRQRVDDAALLALLDNILQNFDFRDAAEFKPFAALLTRIAFHNLDRVLQQANLLGRQGSYVHATCMRFDHEVALFLDNDVQYDWLLPAVQKRLREALAEIKAEADPEQTQLIDLARGEKLRFLDHEFHLTKDRDGTARVEYKRLVKPPEPKPEAQKPSRRNWKLRLPVWPRRARPKPTARAAAPSGRRVRWPSLDLHWPRRSWSWSLNVPRRVYAVAGGVIILVGMLAGTAFLVALFRSHGPQLYPVRGQVIHEGEPAVGALVIFVPKDAKSSQAQLASALVAEDGTYVLGTHKAKDGAQAGEYAVTIWRLPGRKDRMLPARYGNRQTTPLTATVEKGPTEVPVFQLQADSR